MGGMVLETNISEVVTQVDQQNKVEKSETSPTMTIKVIIAFERESTTVNVTIWRAVY